MVSFLEASRSVVKFKSQNWVDKVLIPLLIGAPNAIVMFLAMSDKEVYDRLSEDIPAYITHPFRAHALIFVIILWAITVLARFVLSKMEQTVKDNSEVDMAASSMSAIVNALHIAVDAKAVRFREAFKKFSNTPCGGDLIFKEITQPAQQIKLLTKAIHALFTNVFEHKETQFKVRLVKVNNNQPVEWFSWQPETQTPRTTIDTISIASSSIMRAIKSRNPVIIPDIQKELTVKSKANRNFVKGSFAEDENGSQLSWPIFHASDHEVAYVLSIQSSKQNVFHRDHKGLYARLLDHFMLRIMLEHSLFLLREKSDVE